MIILIADTFLLHYLLLAYQLINIIYIIVVLIAIARVKFINAALLSRIV